MDYEITTAFMGYIGIKETAERSSSSEEYKFINFVYRIYICYHNWPVIIIFLEVN